jgi:hypothetical protein
MHPCLLYSYGITETEHEHEHEHPRAESTWHSPVAIFATAKVRAACRILYYNILPPATKILHDSTVEIPLRLNYPHFHNNFNVKASSPGTVEQEIHLLQHTCH